MVGLDFNKGLFPRGTRIQGENGYYVAVDANGKIDSNINGSVSITGTPTVSISGTPAVTISSGSVSVSSGSMTVTSGDVDIYLKTEFMLASSYSESLHTSATGNIMSMYDGDESTYYTQIGSMAGSGGYWLKWDFGATTTFKNIYIYYHSEWCDIIRLQGSANGTDWTNLDTDDSDTSNHNGNLLCNDQSYRYIRLYFTGNVGGTSKFWVYSIHGVV